ncbi:MAG: Eco57I restriction-modification methylase domain-containing protein [Bryobacteraceae bacterium]
MIASVPDSSIAAGSLLAYSTGLQAEYERSTSLDDRKKKGQFFTPFEVSRFMASLLSADPPSTFRLLDPGAGIGSLSAAVCDRFLPLRYARRLDVHLFENDFEVLPFLRRTMSRCAEVLDEHGHSMTYKIHATDFILDAAATIFGPPSLFLERSEWADFDAVIMNPPYFKLSKTSPYARVMDEVVHGQPNIYAFFLAAAAQMLRPGGEMIAITPRSFCNGLYFRGFRRWFFDKMALDRIHLFESRKEAFRDVLQESLITASHRLGNPSMNVDVSTSRGLGLHSIQSATLPTSSVIDRSCGHANIRIPASVEDRAISAVVESWPDRFPDLGLRISTGPVVMFRATEFLVSESNRDDAAPLLSVFNVKPFQTEWPSIHGKHPAALKVCQGSRRLLLPAQNYVLLRRFSAKEERRRLTASCLLASDIAGSFIAVENHLNYIYHATRELHVDEVYGLAALFNSALLDRYFRIISGNTQVNATEIRSMKFPTLSAIEAVGRKVRKLPSFDDDSVEAIVLEELGIEGEVSVHLLQGTLFSQV